MLQCRACRLQCKPPNSLPDMLNFTTLNKEVELSALPTNGQGVSFPLVGRQRSSPGDPLESLWSVFYF